MIRTWASRNRNASGCVRSWCRHVVASGAVTVATSHPSVVCVRCGRFIVHMGFRGRPPSHARATWWRVRLWRCSRGWDGHRWGRVAWAARPFLFTPRCVRVWERAADRSTAVIFVKRKAKTRAGRVGLEVAELGALRRDHLEVHHAIGSSATVAGSATAAG